MNNRRRRFTLIEILAVITIMVLSATVAVSTLRETPPAQTMQNTVNDFRLFCAKARLRATEFGQDSIVRFKPEERKFYVVAPENASVENLPEVIWVIPEKFTLNQDSLGSLADGEELDLFRFFPDGGTAGYRTFTLQFNTLKRTVSISKLTGQLQVKNDIDE